MFLRGERRAEQRHPGSVGLCAPVLNPCKTEANAYNGAEGGRDLLPLGYLPPLRILLP
ncbi:hypothetical protein CALCODRAFT_497284 [Calocera cornea HHB12733]|uniref:Uncharacterized protein n=1 Tax=Calocera cornea HHB12733 TaxID=1353952 RepID=A0A165FBP3_9BASI|nr:hypothetical protein CALCODRAFT_497284 [Calocera cornea HHB12733]